jgi:hypothetical protein
MAFEFRSVLQITSSSIMSIGSQLSQDDFDRMLSSWNPPSSSTSNPTPSYNYDAAYQQSYHQQPSYSHPSHQSSYSSQSQSTYRQGGEGSENREGSAGASQRLSTSASTSEYGGGEQYYRSQAGPSEGQGGGEVAAGGDAYDDVPNRQFSFGLGDGEAGTIPMAQKQDSLSNWIPSLSSTFDYPSSEYTYHLEPEEIQSTLPSQPDHPPPSSFLSTRDADVDHRPSSSNFSVSPASFSGSRRSRASSVASLYGSPAEGSVGDFGQLEEQAGFLHVNGLEASPGLVGKALRGLSMDEDFTLPDASEPSSASYHSSLASSPAFDVNPSSAQSNYQHNSVHHPSPQHDPSSQTASHLHKVPSPPTLVIPSSDPTSNQTQLDANSNQSSSSSSLLPPLDPRMLGIFPQQSTGLNEPGGVEINVQAATPTSPRSGVFSNHLAALTAASRAAQDLEQQQKKDEHQRVLLQQHQLYQQNSQPSQQSSSSYSSQPPLFSLDQYRAFQIQQQAQINTHQQPRANQSHQIQQPHSLQLHTSTQNQTSYSQSSSWAPSQQPQLFGNSYQYPPSDAPSSSYTSRAYDSFQSHPSADQNQDPFRPRSTSRALKPPPIRQRSKSEASIFPLDFGPSPPPVPTMNPSLLPYENNRYLSYPFNVPPNPSYSSNSLAYSTNQPYFPQPSMMFSDVPSDFSPFPSSSNASPMEFDLPMDGASGSFDGGKARKKERGERGSFGASSGLGRFGPGTPNYGVGMQNPWSLTGAGGGGGGLSGGIGGGGLEVPGGTVGLRRSVSNGEGGRGHRRVSGTVKTSSV